MKEEFSVKRVLTEKKYHYMFLDHSRNVECVRSSALTSSRIYSLVEKPNIFDKELEKEVQTYLGEQVPAA